MGSADHANIRLGRDPSMPTTIDPKAGRPNGDRPLIRIGELASKTDTTLRTLHYYEEIGLIKPAERTKGGFRLFCPDVTQDVQYIQYLRELGLELPQIQSLVAA